MGTGKSGRYLSTAGGRNQVSDYALVHAWEGSYTYLVGHDGKRISKLKSGGHGQGALDVIAKTDGVHFVLLETLPNGVRIGRIDGHKRPRKQEARGHAVFPRDWTPAMVRKAGEYVAKLPANRQSKDGEQVFGTYHGVRVGIIRRGGTIHTVFPSFEQPKRNRKKGGAK